MAGLVATFARAGAGDGQIVEIVGEAGIGKSTLLDAFAEHALAKGARMWRHAPTKPEAGLPWSGLAALVTHATVAELGGLSERPFSRRPSSRWPTSSPAERRAPDRQRALRERANRGFESHEGVPQARLPLPHRVGPPHRRRGRRLKRCDEQCAHDVRALLIALGLP